MFYKTLKSIKFFFVNVKFFKFLNDAVMKIGTLNEALIQKEYNDLFCHEISLHK